MVEPCRRAFDEELISGYLDGELTQADAQRVRLHLEECGACRHLADELERIREATATTVFTPPPDDGWDERPLTPGSRFLRGLGWKVLIVWLAATLSLALWELLTAEGERLTRILIGAVLVGGVSLFLSVLIDRMKVLKTDRYRGVQK